MKLGGAGNRGAKGRHSDSREEKPAVHLYEIKRKDAGDRGNRLAQDKGADGLLTKRYRG